MINSFIHFGISVRDLKISLEFYCEGLGFEISREFTRPADYTEKVTGVKGTDLAAALITRNGIVIELLEYRKKNDRPKKASPVHYPGSAHICLEVTEIAEMVNLLKNKGASFQAEIITVPPGPGEGNKVIYGWDPEGIAFELVETAK